MDLRRTLAGPRAFGRFVCRHARVIWVTVYLSVRRIAGRYHLRRRASTFPLDIRSHRRSIKMVQRNRITSKALQEAFDQIPKELNGATQSFALASAVVRGFLGEKWLDRYVMPNRRRPGFLTMNETNGASLDMSAYRIMDLAELLYNLQNVPGFDECIARMRNGDIEGTHAELDFGRMLYLHKIRFRYVIPSGLKGRDYDVDVIYPNGLAVCGDAKCKVETTEFGTKTIDDTLEKARSQLPADRPGIVFVKLPPKWMEIPNFATISAAVARDFLRTTKRVVSVKYYTSPITFIDDMLKVQHAFQEVSNPITDFGNFQNWNIFRINLMRPEWNGMPPWWQRIIFYPDGKVR
jgi:hypothetical protein